MTLAMDAMGRAAEGVADNMERQAARAFADNRDSPARYMTDAGEITARVERKRSGALAVSWFLSGQRIKRADAVPGIAARMYSRLR